MILPSSSSMQQRTYRTPHLVERRCTPARQYHVEARGQCRLIGDRSVRNLHSPAEPLLGAADGLCGRRCNHVSGERPAARDGLYGSEEPRFLLALRDHYFDPTIRAGGPSALKQRGAKPRRTISLGVEDNQDASAGADTLSGKADVVFQYTVLDHPGAMDANRFQDPRRTAGCNFQRNPSKQHRHRLHFAVAFDNRQNRRQAQALRNRSTRCGAAS